MAGTETPQRAMLLATLGAELTWGDPGAPERSAMPPSQARRLDDDQARFEVLARRPFTIWSPARSMNDRERPRAARGR